MHIYLKSVFICIHIIAITYNINIFIDHRPKELYLQCIYRPCEARTVQLADEEEREVMEWSKMNRYRSTSYISSSSSSSVATNESAL